MENKDLDRALVINTMVRNKQQCNYNWVKEFVFSNILEQYVALAGEGSLRTDNENIVLIDVFGNVIDTNF